MENLQMKKHPTQTDNHELPQLLTQTTMNSRRNYTNLPQATIFGEAKVG